MIERLDVGREAGGERQRPVDQFLQVADAGVDLDAAFDGFLERLRQRLDDAVLDLEELRPGARQAFDAARACRRSALSPSAG